MRVERNKPEVFIFIFYFSIGIHTFASVTDFKSLQGTICTLNKSILINKESCCFQWCGEATFTSS